MAMALDGSEKMSLRLARFPGRREATLWMSAFVGGSHYAAAFEGLDLAPFFGVTPVEEDRVTFTVGEGGEGAVVESRDRLGSAMVATISAETPAHESLHPPLGRGGEPLRIEAEFRARHEGVRVRTGRWEVFGEVTAKVSFPGGEVELRAPGKWHEQVGTRPRFAPAFTYFTVQGSSATEQIALLARRGPTSDPWGYFLEADAITLVDGFSIDAYGPSERSFQVSLADGRTLEGTAFVLRQASVPIEGQRRPGASVRVESNLGAMVGHLNDWNPAP